MKVIHQGGFSNAELAEFRPVVYKNVLDSAHQILAYMKKIGMKCHQDSNQVLAEKVMNCKLETYNGQPLLAQEMAEAIHQLVRDPAIPKLIDEHSSKFYLMDSAQYFLGEVLRIGTPGYLPDVIDVLKAQQKSVGITETRFIIGNLALKIFDIGGQQSEREKWMHCFESLTSVIFCTALSEYDEVLLEEKPHNRMAESLILFESVVNSRWFRRTSIILFFNKLDVFKLKLPKVPLERSFPEYTGGKDIKKAVKHIMRKFMKVNRAHLKIYPHISQGTDPANLRLVFAAVKETISLNSLKNNGFLE